MFGLISPYICGMTCLTRNDRPLIALATIQHQLDNSCHELLCIMQYS